MAKLGNLDWKAIKWWGELYNLKVQLSPYPDIEFKDEDGEKVIVNISLIRHKYDTERKVEKKRKIAA